MEWKTHTARRRVDRDSLSVIESTLATLSLWLRCGYIFARRYQLNSVDNALGGRQSVKVGGTRFFLAKTLL